MLNEASTKTGLIHASSVKDDEWKGNAATPFDIRHSTAANRGEKRAAWFSP